MSGFYRPVDPWGLYPEVGAPAKRPPSPTDHIPALRGLFALARGDYATVSPEDLTAAVDAGYVHPDVLAAVADEIAFATEIESIKGYQKGLLRRFPMEPENVE